MNRLIRIDTEEVRQLILDRVSHNPVFRGLISVSVEQYPDDLFVTVWIGPEPDEKMRQCASELEAELERLGAPGTVLVKSERELLRGSARELATARGKFSSRHYRIEPEGDEDWVFVFSVSAGQETYRFRFSLTRTLASMLRGRNLLDERRILDIYADEVKLRLERGGIEPEEVNPIMFGSRDIARFAA